VIASNTLNVKEILKIHVYLIEKNIYPNHQITNMSDMSIKVIYHAMSLTVLYIMTRIA